MNHMWLTPIVWLVIGTIMIWQNKSRMSLVSAGVMIGVAATILTEAYLPLAINVAAYFWQALGLGWFMVLFGGLALGMIWAFDRW